jgi:DNA-binding phage protein
MTKKEPKYREFKDYLFEKLKDPEHAFAYLNTAFDDEDERVFLLALKNVLQAHLHVLRYDLAIRPFKSR